MSQLPFVFNLLSHCSAFFLFHIFCFLQELKEKQREYERKAKLAEDKSNLKQEPLFKSSAPLQRKQPNVSKPSKQQAVVQPLQGQLRSFYETKCLRSFICLFERKDVKCDKSSELLLLMLS